MVPFEGESTLLGGDFNFYMDPKLDKLDSMSNKSDNPIYRNEILSLIEVFNLSDCRRDLNPTTRRYTWHSRGISSRLDYWLISDHLLNEIHSFDIMPGLHSDHSILKITLRNNDLVRGKDFWKFNNTLLHDTYYDNQIKHIIKYCEDEYSTLEDRGLAWEMTKFKIRSFSIQYCVKKKGKR